MLLATFISASFRRKRKMANNDKKTNKKPKQAAYALPHNSQAESAVIGSALLSKDCLYTILSELVPEDFYEPKNQILYNVFANLVNKKVAVDTLTVTEELMNIKELNNIGGVPYLQECTDLVPALSSFNFYVNIVRDQSTLRSMLTAIREIDNDYRSGEIEDVDLFLRDSEAKFKKALERRRVSTFVKMSEVTKQLQLILDEPPADGDEQEVTGLTTGYDSLNRVTQGFQKGELTIIAARPSVGKTAIALNFAYNIATRKRIPVAIFSAEMSSVSLGSRLLGIDSGVPLERIKDRHLTDNQKVLINRSLRNLNESTIFIDETPNVNILDIVAKSHQLQAKNPDLGLIIVDYIGLVSSGQSAKNGDSRQEEVRKISLALKALARELNIPVIGISQLSRNVEQRTNKRPLLSDLRDSGSIEQDADVVILLYREDYYDGQKDTKKKLKELEGDERTNMSHRQAMAQLLESSTDTKTTSLTEVNVAKNRNGKTGKVLLFFNRSHGRFNQPPKEWEEEALKLLKGEDID